MKKLAENKMNIPGLENWKNILNRSDIEENRIARIAAVNKTNFNLITNESEILGELSGRLMYSSEGETDLPVAGDFVVVDVFDELGIIHQVLPRFSFIKRKSSGKKIGIQAIASNIDYALVVQAVDTDFNLNRLERYLAMIYEAKISPVLILTKTDLVDKEELEEKISLVKNNYTELIILSVSNISKDGLEKIMEILKPDKTYCLLGSSGVGKSSLINNITNSHELAVGEVRESDKKGKHTTTRRELIRLDNGSILIDTPGMRELANFDIDEGLLETFNEIYEIIKECKFSDCNHINDSGCALVAAVEEDRISEKRYNNFIKLKKENEYYESSYLEKRKKDKEFGKMVKQVMKVKKAQKK